jgi:hypothetical protein
LSLRMRQDGGDVDLNELVEIEAIKRLKYRYMRYVDLKLWDEMGTCFTDDASVSYDSGRWSCIGRDEIVKMLAAGLGPEVVSSHTVHHPEIDLTSATTATGTWALQDYVFNRRKNTTLHGTAFYWDEYVKVGEHWLFSHTGYVRHFEQRSGLEPQWGGA